MSRPRIKVKHGEESLVSHSGLILIGALLEATNLKDRLSQINIRCDQRKYTHADIAFAMMALISIGKPDYDAIESFRDNPRFFNDALGLSGCPSSATLRQRLEVMAEQRTYQLLKQESALLVRLKAPAITPLSTGGVCLFPWTSM